MSYKNKFTKKKHKATHDKQIVRMLLRLHMRQCCLKWIKYAIFFDLDHMLETTYNTRMSYVRK